MGLKFNFVIAFVLLRSCKCVALLVTKSGDLFYLAEFVMDVVNVLRVAWMKDRNQEGEEIHLWTFDVCCFVSVFVMDDSRRRSNT
jgi:hypothetical protein